MPRRGKLPAKVAKVSTEVRGKDGKFKPGVSGAAIMRASNESHAAYMRRLARMKTPEALERIYSIMMDPKASHSDQLKAAGMLLDRAYGKPTQVVEQLEGSNRLHEIPTAELVTLIRAEQEKLQAKTGSRALPTPEIIAADGNEA